jgi:PAS domain S-box-containing protein
MQPESTDSDMTGGSTAPVNVLLVDDTPAKLLTYEVALADLGENLIKAGSADEALQILLKKDVALVVADVSMPSLDGFEFAKLVRDHPRFRTTPIIFVSAIALSDLDRLQGYASGGLDYVTVPVAPELLRAKVKVFVELYRKQRELEQLKGELEARVAQRTRDLHASTARLAESEERLRLAQEAGDLGLWDWNLATGEVYWSQKLRSLFGVSETLRPTPALFLGLVNARDRVGVKRAVQAAISGQRPFHHEFRLGRSDGTEIWVLGRGEIKAGSDGRPTRLIGIVADITDRKRSQQSLAESEERYRTLVDNANDIVATLDLEGRLTSVNPAVERILGYAPRELIGMSLSGFVPEDEISMHETMLRCKPTGEAATRYEMQLIGKSGRRFTLEVNSKLMVNERGKPTGIHAIGRDISERKEAEARQAVLVRELQHRTKNMLAVIQSIATSTLSRSKDLGSAQEALIGRLHALAHAQEFVAAGPGGGVPLRDLVECELSAFGARTIINGEAIVVGGAFAQTFALVVHELATNAVKHGSLSSERGRVVLDWRIDRSTADQQLCFSWMERGGPPASPPEYIGLGTRLMSLVGKSRAAFKEEGFEFFLTVPLDEAVRGRE